MRRKEAVRPSDSSENSATSRGVTGPVSSSGSGPMSTSTVGPALSSVGDPSSNPITDLLTCPKLSSNLYTEPVSDIFRSDLLQLVAAQSVGGLAGQPTASQCCQLTRSLPDNHTSTLHHRGSRPARQLGKPTRPRAVSSADTDRSVSSAVLSTPMTLSQSVSQSDNTDSDMSAAGAAVLSKPVTLSQSVDNAADIRLDTLTHSETVSTRDTDFSGGNVTEL